MTILSDEYRAEIKEKVQAFLNDIEESIIAKGDCLDATGDVNEDLYHTEKDEVIKEMMSLIEYTLRGGQ